MIDWSVSAYSLQRQLILCDHTFFKQRSYKIHLELLHILKGVLYFSSQRHVIAVSWVPSSYCILSTVTSFFLRKNIRTVLQIAVFWDSLQVITFRCTHHAPVLLTSARSMPYCKQLTLAMVRWTEGHLGDKKALTASRYGPVKFPYWKVYYFLRDPMQMWEDTKKCFI